MTKRIILLVVVSAVAAFEGRAAQQPPITTQVLRGYLEKMGLRYVPHPKNPAALVVPRAENKNAERLDLYAVSYTHLTLPTIYSV